MKWRFIALLALILVQLWVPVWFGSTSYAASPFPTAEELARDDYSDAGKEVLIYGQIVALDPIKISIDIDGENEIQYRVDGIQREVAVGEYLEVYGVVESNNTISARGTVIRGEREHWYTYGISLIAVAIVFSRVARDWTFDKDQIALVPGDDNA